MKKREQWRLPKTFEVSVQDDDHHVQRHDGEPVLHHLENHANDRTMSTRAWTKCCDCGLTHLHTYNVMKGPDGNWWLLTRAYRVPGSTKESG